MDHQRKDVMPNLQSGLPGEKDMIMQDKCGSLKAVN